MDSENIIAVNVPNAISILIMAAIGGVVAAALRKLVTGKGGQKAKPMDAGAQALMSS